MISESRSSGRGGSQGSLQIGLVISGEGLPRGTLLKGITVTRAEDDRGNPVPTAGAGRQIGFSGAPAPGSTTLQGSVGLGLVPRGAKALRILEGTLDLYVPSDANGSSITIPDMTTAAGPVAVADPTKAGLLLHVFRDQESYDRLCAAVGLDPSPRPKFPSVGFFLRDPTGLFRGWSLDDAAGRQVMAANSQRGDDTTGVLVTMTLLSAPAPGTRLTILRNPPGSTQTVPFHLEEIALP